MQICRVVWTKGIPKKEKEGEGDKGVGKVGEGGIERGGGNGGGGEEERRERGGRESC